MSRQAFTPGQAVGSELANTNRMKAQIKANFNTTTVFWSRAPPLTLRPWTAAARRMTALATAFSGIAERHAEGRR
jgi:hypothetical protein